MISRLHTYIGECCREWPMAAGGRGTCGLCGEVPTYKRRDDDCLCVMCMSDFERDEFRADEVWCVGCDTWIPLVDDPDDVPTPHRRCLG